VRISGSDTVYQSDIFLTLLLIRPDSDSTSILRSVVNRVLSIDFEGMLNLFSKILSIVFSI